MLFELDETWIHCEANLAGRAGYRPCLLGGLAAPRWVENRQVKQGKTKPGKPPAVLSS